MEERKYTVYKHTSPEGKSYIGLTSQPPNNRFRNGDGYKFSDALYSDIQKFGWDSFTHDLLYEGLTREEGKKKEQEMIILYETKNPEKGYNCRKGGDAMSDESIEKMQKTRKETGVNDRCGEYLKEFWSDAEASAKRRENINESLKREETKKKKSIAMKRIMSDPTIRDARVRATMEGAKNRSKESWEKSVAKMAELRKEHPEKFDHSGRPKRKVVQSDPKTGEVIQIWDYARGASRAIGSGISSVSTACNLQVNLHGSHWDYLDTVEIKDGFVINRAKLLP